MWNNFSMTYPIDLDRKFYLVEYVNNDDDYITEVVSSHEITLEIFDDSIKLIGFGILQSFHGKSFDDLSLLQQVETINKMMAGRNEIDC